MKRLFLILAVAFILAGGTVYAGYVEGPEQYSVPQKKIVIVQPKHNDDGWTTTNKIAAAGVAVTALGVIGGLYLNSRRKK